MPAFIDLTKSLYSQKPKATKTPTKQPLPVQNSGLFGSMMAGALTPTDLGTTSKTSTLAVAPATTVVKKSSGPMVFPLTKQGESVIQKRDAAGPSMTPEQSEKAAVAKRVRNPFTNEDVTIPKDSFFGRLAAVGEFLAPDVLQPKSDVIGDFAERLVASGTTDEKRAIKLAQTYYDDTTLGKTAKLYEKDLTNEESNTISDFLMERAGNIAVQVGSLGVGGAEKKAVGEVAKRVIPKAGGIFSRVAAEGAPAVASEVVETAATAVSKEVPEMVGNLNMKYLDIPEQSKKEVASFVERFGVTKSETKSFKQIEEMADELRMTPDDLIRLQQEGGGKISAENLALRKMEVTAVDDALKTAKTLDANNPEQIKAFTDSLKTVLSLNKARVERVAEAGRALSAQRITAGYDTDKVLALKELFEQIDPTNKDMLGELEGLIREIPAPTFWDKVTEFTTAMKLTSPKSIERNWIGNVLDPIYSPAKKLLTGVYDAAGSAVSGKPREAYISDALEDIKGRITAVPDGFRNFLKALADENFSSLGSQVDLPKKQAIGGRLGKVVRLPFRLLNDEFFHTIAVSAETRTLAAREGRKLGLSGNKLSQYIDDVVANPTARIVEEARSLAAQATYREELGPIMSLASNVVSQLPFGIGRILIPFIKTPTNIVRKFAREKSVFSLLAPKNLQAIKAGGVARTEALAKMTLGTLSTAATMSLALTGKVTGRGPKNAAERDALYETGWQPYSIKIGDKYYSYASLGEITLALGTAADAVEAYTDVKSGQAEATDLAARSMLAFSNNIFNQSFLSTLQDTMDAATDGSKAGKFAANLISGLVVPSGVRNIAQSSDRTIRDPQGTLQKIQAGVPGLTGKVPPKLSVFGEEKQREGGFIRNFLSPITVTREKYDTVEAELKRLKKTVPFPSANQLGVRLPEEEQQKFLKISGKATKAVLDTILKSESYQDLSDPEREQVVDKVVSKARDAARNGLAGEILISAYLGESLPDPKVRKAANVLFGSIIQTKEWGKMDDAQRESLVKSIYLRLLEKTNKSIPTPGGEVKE